MCHTQLHTNNYHIACYGISQLSLCGVVVVVVGGVYNMQAYLICITNTTVDAIYVNIIPTTTKAQI